MGPNVPADSGSKKIIRPFCYAPKDLIETCARDFEFPDIGNCDYSKQLDESGDRAYLEKICSTVCGICARTICLIHAILTGVNHR